MGKGIEWLGLVFFFPFPIELGRLKALFCSPPFPLLQSEEQRKVACVSRGHLCYNIFMVQEKRRKGGRKKGGEESWRIGGKTSRGKHNI